MRLYGSDPHIARNISTKFQVKQRSAVGDMGEWRCTSLSHEFHGPLPLDHKISLSAMKPAVRLWPIFPHFWWFLWYLRLDWMPKPSLHPYSWFRPLKSYWNYSPSELNNDSRTIAVWQSQKFIAPWYSAPNPKRTYSICISQFYVKFNIRLTKLHSSGPAKL